MKITALLVTMVTIAGCTNFTNSNKQTVIVETPMVEHAECDLIDQVGNQWMVFDTPEVVTITSGYGPLTLQCLKPGYKKTIVQIRERYPHEMPLKEYQYMMRSGLSLIKDISHDVGKRYPDVLVVLMEPKQFRDEEERIDWLAAKQSYEKMYQEPDRSDRLLELKKVEKDMQRHMLERQLREEAKVEQELQGEAFIRRNRRITGLKENIATQAEIRKTLQRTLLDHYRVKLGFKPAVTMNEKGEENGVAAVTPKQSPKQADTQADKGQEDALHRIQSLRDMLKSPANATRDMKPDEGRLMTKEVMQSNGLTEGQGEEDTSQPISIVPEIKP